MKRPSGALLPLLGWLGLLVFLCTLILWFAVSHSRKALATYKSSLEKRGETFNVEELAPVLPPGATDGAGALMSAGTQLKAVLARDRIKPYAAGMKEISAGKAEVLHRRAFAWQLSKDISWEDFRNDMESLRSALAELRQAARAPVLEVALDYQKGFAMPLDFLSPFLSSSQFLAAEGLLALHDGDVAWAAENIETTLRIAGMVNRQPVLICRLVAIAMVGTCQAATWEFLQAGPDAPELLRVQKAWENFSVLDGIPAVCRMERACGMPYFSAPLDSLTALAATPPSPLPPPSHVAQFINTAEWAAWSLIFRHSDERHFLARYQSLIDRLEDGNAWNALLAEADAQQTASHPSDLGRKLSGLSFSAINDSLAKIGAAASLHSVTIAAIAIHRYQADHAGEPPASLQNLIPGYLSSLPVDPMDGSPLRYKKEGSRFLLYAIGLNGRDDGGDAASRSGRKNRGPLDGLDIVWPQAASAFIPASGGSDLGTPRE